MSAKEELREILHKHATQKFGEETALAAILSLVKKRVLAGLPSTKSIPEYGCTDVCEHNFDEGFNHAISEIKQKLEELLS